MTTLKDINPQLDSSVIVFLASDRTLRRLQSNSTTQIQADIIGIYENILHKEYMLAWKSGSVYPQGAWGKRVNVFSKALDHTYSKNLAAYDRTFWVQEDYEAMEISKTNGCKCGCGAACDAHCWKDSVDEDMKGALNISRMAKRERLCVNQTCGKMNDLTAKICWWCQCPQ